MAFWSNIFKRNTGNSGTLANPGKWFIDRLKFGNSGMIVTSETALGITAVWACVRLISDTIASLEKSVYKINKNGDFIEADEHPLYEILKYRWSSLYTSYSGFETAQSHVLLGGNLYLYPIRNLENQVKELRLFNPEQTTIKLTKQEVTPYAQTLRYTNTEYPGLILNRDEIIHIPVFSKDGIIGRSPILAANDTLNMSANMLMYGNRMFGNGAHPSGMLEHPGELSKTAQDRLKDQFRKEYQGTDNIGNVIVLEEGMKFTPVQMSPEMLKMIENRKYQTEEIARIYSVPLHMIQSLDRATNNNIEQQSIDFVRTTIRPWVKRWENELNSILFVGREKGKYFIRFNLDSLLRGDTAARAAFYNTLWNIGSISSNEIRKLENMPSRKGGDEYFTPLAMQGSESPKIEGNGTPDPAEN